MGLDQGGDSNMPGRSLVGRDGGAVGGNEDLCSHFKSKSVAST